MRYIPLLILLILPIQAEARHDYFFMEDLKSQLRFSENEYQPWMGVSVGKDIYHLDNDSGERFRALTFSGGLFPEAKKGFGFITYLEYADMEENKNEINGHMWTIGFEPIWKYKNFYAGLGLSMSEKKTPSTGTKWNFSIPIGFRFDLEKENLFIDVNFRHRSHGSAFGIQENRSNSGLNLLNLQFGVNF